MEISAEQIGVTITSDDCLEDCPRGIVTRFLGETEAIEGLAEESTDFWKQGLSDGVRKLIETACCELLHAAHLHGGIGGADGD